MWLPEVKPYSSLRSCLVIYIASNVQGCQKKLAAGENRCLLGWYRPATLLGISLQMVFFK